MSTPKFAETHNLVAFLDNFKESEGFEQIIDFMNESSIRYALTVNPTIYTTCIEQFWATAKVKKVNGERQIKALVDKKRVIITDTSIRSYLMLEDAERTYCLPTPTIFAELERMRAYISDEATNEEHVSTLYYDPSQSGKDRLQLTELMSLCTSLQEKVLDLEKAKTAQAKEIASLKNRAKQLEKRKKSITLGLKRLRKVGSASRVESSNDVSLGAQEDASKQERKIANLDDDDEVTLIDETQERNDEEMLFDVQDDLQGKEVVADKEVAEKQVSATDPVTTGGEVVTNANVEVTTASALTTTIDEPKARGVVVQEPCELKTTSSPLQASQLPQAKDKGKAKIVEPEKPLKKKDQIAMDEEVSRNLEAQLYAELEEEDRISRLKE
ncbi:hypothetical protein Tco_1416862 [Tanacetum coccineum]